VGQLVIITLLPLMLAAVLFSYTRSVWLGFGLGMMIVMGLSLRGQWRPLLFGSVVGLGTIVALLGSENLVGFKREQSAQETAHSAGLRASFAYVSWQMFLDRPVFGFGFGQFPEAKMPYLYDRNTELDLEFIRPLVHHNHFLCVLTETGLVGFTLFLSIIACWAARAWKLARRDGAPPHVRAQGILLLGSLAVWAAQLAFHDLSFSVIDSSLIFFLAGLTMGMRTEPASAQAPATRPLATGPAFGRLHPSG
jgi:O-antigen ligase